MLQDDAYNFVGKGRLLKIIFCFDYDLRKIITYIYLFSTERDKNKQLNSSMYNESISSPSIKIIAKHNLKDVFKCRRLSTQLYEKKVGICIIIIIVIIITMQGLFNGNIRSNGVCKKKMKRNYDEKKNNWCCIPSIYNIAEIDEYDAVFECFEILILCRTVVSRIYLIFDHLICEKEKFVVYLGKKFKISIEILNILEIKENYETHAITFSAQFESPNLVSKIKCNSEYKIVNTDYCNGPHPVKCLCQNTCSFLIREIYNSVRRIIIYFICVGRWGSLMQRSCDTDHVLSMVAVIQKIDICAAVASHYVSILWMTNRGVRPKFYCPLAVTRREQIGKNPSNRAGNKSSVNLGRTLKNLKFPCPFKRISYSALERFG
ncbi:hypothetical protein QTP88_004969 [Uroleucon formosanum]